MTSRKRSFSDIAEQDTICLHTGSDDDDDNQAQDGKRRQVQDKRRGAEAQDKRRDAEAQNEERGAEAQVTATTTTNVAISADALRQYFNVVAPHSVLDLDSDEARECLLSGKFPAACALLRTTGIEQHNLYVLNGFAYSRDQLCKWIGEFFNKSDMPTCPLTRNVISDDDLTKLGFVLANFRGYRLRAVRSALQPSQSQQQVQQEQQLQQLQQERQEQEERQQARMLDLTDASVVAAASDLEIGTTLYFTTRREDRFSEDIQGAALVNLPQSEHLLQFYKRHADALTTVALQSGNRELLALLHRYAMPQVDLANALRFLLGSVPAAPTVGFCNDLMAACSVPFRQVPNGNHDFQSALDILSHHEQMARRVLSTNATLDSAQRSALFHSLCFGAIFTAILRRDQFLYCDRADQRLQAHICCMLSITADFFATDPTASTLEHQVAVLLFDYAAQCNSSAIFEDLLRLFKCPCVFSNDEVGDILSSFAKHDRLQMFTHYETLIAQCERYANAPPNALPIDKALLVAVRHFSTDMALALYTQKMSSIARQEVDVATAVASSEKNAILAEINDFCGRSLTCAIEVGNAPFLIATFATASVRLTLIERQCIAQLAIRTGVMSVVEAVLRPELIVNVKDWCEFLDEVPRHCIGIYNFIWKMGKPRFLLNVREEDWYTVCSTALESLCLQLRKSCSNGTLLWLSSMPLGFFEKQYHTMLIEACLPNSPESQHTFEVLLRERNRRTDNQRFDYFFNNGALLRKASIVGAYYVVEYLVEHLSTLCSDAQMATIFYECLGNSIRYKHWRVFTLLLRGMQDFEQFYQQPHQHRLLELLETHAAEQNGPFLNAILAAIAPTQ